MIINREVISYLVFGLLTIAVSIIINYFFSKFLIFKK